MNKTYRVIAVAKVKVALLINADCKEDAVSEAAAMMEEGDFSGREIEEVSEITVDGKTVKRVESA